MWWIFLPILVVSLLYFAVTAYVWPYARPIVPLWFLLLVIFFPPFFPFFFFYILFAASLRPVLARPTVVVVESPRASRRSERV